MLSEACSIHYQRNLEKQRINTEKVLLVTLFQDGKHVTFSQTTISGLLQLYSMSMNTCQKTLEKR